MKKLPKLFCVRSFFSFLLLFNLLFFFWLFQSKVLQIYRLLFYFYCFCRLNFTSVIAIFLLMNFLGERSARALMPVSLLLAFLFLVFFFYGNFSCFLFDFKLNLVFIFFGWSWLWIIQWLVWLSFVRLREWKSIYIWAMWSLKTYLKIL